jgi:hypothetical protein
MQAAAEKDKCTTTPPSNPTIRFVAWLLVYQTQTGYWVFSHIFLPRFSLHSRGTRRRAGGASFTGGATSGTNNPSPLFFPAPRKTPKPQGKRLFVRCDNAQTYFILFLPIKVVLSLAPSGR